MTPICTCKRCRAGRPSSPGPRHRSLDPVERLDVAVPISVKAHLIHYCDVTGRSRPAVLAELIRSLDVFE